MLTPHEFATLMLVRQAPEQLDMNRAELDALLERQLVMLEHCASGARRAHLTGKGRMFLNALQPDDTSGSRHHNESGKRPKTTPAPGARTTGIVMPGLTG
jgi:hypothetical protein